MKRCLHWRHRAFVGHTIVVLFQSLCPLVRIFQVRVVLAMVVGGQNLLNQSTSASTWVLFSALCPFDSGYISRNETPVVFFITTTRVIKSLIKGLYVSWACACYVCAVFPYLIVRALLILLRLPLKFVHRKLGYFLTCAVHVSPETIKTGYIQVNLNLPGTPKTSKRVFNFYLHGVRAQIYQNKHFYKFNSNFCI